MTDIKLRPATLGDADGVNAVYNPFIVSSPATFETREHRTEEREIWISEHQGDPRHPVWVATLGDEVCGFASASAFDPRGAYETSVKTSVFVDPAAGGRGVGKKLYEALFNDLTSADVHRAYALIVAPNPASVALHEDFGFIHVSTLSEVGRKFGRYYDVMWFEKRF